MVVNHVPAPMPHEILQPSLIVMMRQPVTSKTVPATVLRPSLERSPGTRFPDLLKDAPVAPSEGQGDYLTRSVSALLNPASQVVRERHKPLPGDPAALRCREPDRPGLEVDVAPLETLNFRRTSTSKKTDRVKQGQLVGVSQERRSLTNRQDRDVPDGCLAYVASFRGIPLNPTPGGCCRPVEHRSHRGFAQASSIEGQGIEDSLNVVDVDGGNLPLRSKLPDKQVSSLPVGLMRSRTSTLLRRNKSIPRFSKRHLRPGTSTMPVDVVLHDVGHRDTGREQVTEIAGDLLLVPRSRELVGVSHGRFPSREISQLPTLVSKGNRHRNHPRVLSPFDLPRLKSGFFHRTYRIFNESSVSLLLVSNICKLLIMKLSRWRDSNPRPTIYETANAGFRYQGVQHLCGCFETIANISFNLTASITHLKGGAA